jgi:methionyl-tRNA formyltransferase
MPQRTRIVMFGTGNFALPTFEHLYGTGHNVVGLVTQPERPQGRNQERIMCRTKQAALTHKIPIAQPEQVNAAESLELIKSWEPGLFVTAAYGQILSGELLALAPLGGINLHASLLPSYRGAAPVARAIQNGERETGVTVIRMTPQIDAGGIILRKSTPIGPDETAGELEVRLARLGAPLVVEAVAEIVHGAARILKQKKASVTRAPKLRKEDGQIDWSLAAQQIHNLVRAMHPWPSAFTNWYPEQAGKSPVRLLIHKTHVQEGQGDPGRVLESHGDKLVIGTGQGTVRILNVQPAGKRPMPVDEFLRGHHVSQGDRMAP